MNGEWKENAGKFLPFIIHHSSLIVYPAPQCTTEKPALRIFSPPPLPSSRRPAAAAWPGSPGLSAAIGEMVFSYSIGKKDLIPFDAELKHAAHELQLAREVLLKLMVEDQEAYAELTAARKLPADSPDRKQRLPIAVLARIRCPQAVGATAVAVLKLCDQLVEIVNPWLLSDLAVSAELAMATVRAATYNVA